MNSKLKERLVGGLVIVFLALIFIPPMYDGRNPFDVDEAAYRVEPPRVPKFAGTEEFANQIAEVGSGRISKIEQQVKADIPASARSDSLLVPDESSTSLSGFSPSEMTARLLSEIAERSNLSARFNNKKQLKHAWAVQVGSFAEVERAQKLRDELLARDYQAFIKTVMVDNKEISRVFAGVSLDKSITEEIHKKLLGSKIVDNALIVPYQP